MGGEGHLGGGGEHIIAGCWPSVGENWGRGVQMELQGGGGMDVHDGGGGVRMDSGEESGRRMVISR